MGPNDNACEGLGKPKRSFKKGFVMKSEPVGKAGSYGSLLKQRGFLAFLGTQFLGALNDNLLKYVTIFLATAGLLSGTSGSAGLDLSYISLFAVLPTLLFTGVAGYLADNFEKRRVLVATKSVEIFVMLMAWLALRSGSFQAQVAVLFLLSIQFTFFGPSKYGVVPELVDDAALSKANGLLEMSTFAAILLGSVLAGPLFTDFKRHLDVIGAAVLGIAVFGSILSLGIPHTPRPRRSLGFRWRFFWSEIGEGTRVLRSDRRLWTANLGAANFWFQGALFQMDLVLLGEQTLRLDANGVTHLFMALALGIGAGSILAGTWSGPIVELGLVPLGALGMGLFSVVLGLSAGSHPALVYPVLVLIGGSAGLFVVPLNALLQQKPAFDAKGRVQAAANFFSTLAMVFAALLYGVLSRGFGMSAPQIAFFAGAVCVAVTVGMVSVLPEFAVRAVLWLAAWGSACTAAQSNAVPVNGAALLICGPTDFDEGLLIHAHTQRRMRFVAPGSSSDSVSLRRLLAVGGHLVAPSHQEGLGAARAWAAEELKAGHVVCVLAKGALAGGRAQTFAQSLRGVLRSSGGTLVSVRTATHTGSLSKTCFARLMFGFLGLPPRAVALRVRRISAP